MEKPRPGSETPALNALCPGQDITKCNHYNTWNRQKRRLPLLRRATATSQSQLVGHIALTRGTGNYRRGDFHCYVGQLSHHRASLWVTLP